MKQNYETTVKSIQNPDGPKLCWSEQSGMKLIEKDGLYFKDLAGTILQDEACENIKALDNDELEALSQHMLELAVRAKDKGEES